MKKDRVYSKNMKKVPPFEFNEDVVEVFEDMITRSVPHYQENLDYQIDLASRFYQAGTLVYDLGASHGNFSLGLLKKMAPQNITLISVDASEPMCHKLRCNAGEGLFLPKIICGKIQDLKLHHASVIALNYTMQFIAQAEREALLRKIYRALNSNGILLLSEKMTHESEDVQNLQFDFLKEFKKKNGYSELEISQKREALDNVLIPETLDEHLSRLKKVGFKKIEIYLKCFSFTSLIAWK